MESSDNQLENNNKPWLWKKGQSGNLKGRPKGMTMKEYAKDYLSRLTDEERDEWLEGLPKDIVWRMSEGNPETKTDITTAGKPIIQVAKELIDKHEIITNDSNSSTSDDSQK